MLVDATPWPSVLDATDDAELGRLLVLAGRTAEGQARLQHAASSCLLTHGDAWSNTAAIIRASYDLGQLDEQLGDIPGACAAYQKVIDHWGHATPRSVTGKAASKAWEKLHCPAP